MEAQWQSLGLKRGRWLPSPCSFPLKAPPRCGGWRSGSQHGASRSPLGEERLLRLLTGRSLERGRHLPPPRWQERTRLQRRQTVVPVPAQGLLLPANPSLSCGQMLVLAPSAGQRCIFVEQLWDVLKGR